MRTILLSITITICFHFQAYAQLRPDLVEVSYSASHKTIKEVLKDLVKYTGVSIAYSEHIIPEDQRINLSVINEKLGVVLGSVLNPAGLDYRLVGNQIVIVKGLQQFQNELFTIYGYVKDAMSNESLIGANVYLPDKSSGTSTNQAGFYSFKIKGGHQRIYFSYLGYKTAVADFQLYKDTVIHVRLKADGKLNEIIIIDNLLEQEHESAGEVKHLHLDKLRSTFHPGGDADLFRYVHNLSGVSSGADGIGGLSVRGGAPDQNLITLDGVPVYNPAHALGIMSSFNPDIIKSASFIKGSVPARFSGRISSVLDIYTRDGNSTRLGGSLSISPLLASASLEGPLLTPKAGFLVSYRKTYMNLWMNALSQKLSTDQNSDTDFGYDFHDLNVKLSYSINEKNKLQVHYFSAGDDFNNTSKQQTSLFSDSVNNELAWKSSMISAKWASELSEIIFSRITAYRTDYNYNRYHRNSYSRISLGSAINHLNAGLTQSGIYENGILWDIDWMLYTDHFVRLGAAYRHRNFRPLSIHFAGNPADNPDLWLKANRSEIVGNYRSANSFSGELSTYIEDDFRLSSFVKLNAGLHTTYVTNYDNHSTLAVQPRLAILGGNDFVHFKAGASRMFQPMQMITAGGIGLNTELWLGMDRALPGAGSWLLNTGLGVRNKNGYKFSIDLYYRAFDRLISEQEGRNTLIHAGSDWKPEIGQGDGKAYGLECGIEKASGPFLFNANYSFTVSERLFSLLNNGNAYPYQNNRLHNAKASVIYKTTGFSELIINWNLASGNHFTSPSNALVLTDNQIVLLFTDKNNASFPVYHRLDAGICFYQHYKWGNGKLFLGVYNLFNRHNPFYINISRSADNPERLQLNQFSLMPAMPSISYSISW